MNVEDVVTLGAVIAFLEAGIQQVDSPTTLTLNDVKQHFDPWGARRIKQQDTRFAQEECYNYRWI